MVSYHKLFVLLAKRNMKLTDLRQILSSCTIAKLRKGEYISGHSLEEICLFLKCQVGDVIEIVFDEN